ncbi:MAG: type II toxin-antitoxin system VapC family toxin [Gaiellaceae bacterium]
MRLLLDTHVAIWFFDDPTLVADDAREAIGDPTNRAFLSAASVWEIALKRSLGRITMPDGLDVGATRAGIEELPVTWAHGRAAAELPPVHRDPFDRMLVAQAMLENLVLVTRDPLVMQYDIGTMHA